MQGRVFMASEATLTLPYTLSIALGAVLVGVIDFRTLYLVVSAVMVLGGLLLYRAGAEHAPSGVPSAAIEAEAPDVGGPR
jgi:hypothetical protein